MTLPGSSVPLLANRGPCLKHLLRPKTFSEDQKVYSDAAIQSCQSETVGNKTMTSKVQEPKHNLNDEARS